MLSFVIFLEILWILTIGKLIGHDYRVFGKLANLVPEACNIKFWTTIFYVLTSFLILSIIILIAE